MTLSLFYDTLQVENSYSFLHVLFPFTTLGMLFDIRTMMLMTVMTTINLWNISFSGSQFFNSI